MTGTLISCQELEQVRTFSPEEVVAPVLHDNLPDEITVTSENMGNTVTFTWDAADFGAPTQINYAVEAAYNNDTLAVMTGITGTSSEQTYELLNSLLALSAEDGGLGVPADTPTDVDFLVSATIGETFGKYYSEGVTVKMTVTEAERTYPMVYVIGDYSTWQWDTAQKLYSFSNDEVTYSGVVGFNGAAANGFKITGATNWDNGNWGLDGNAAAPEAEAASITLINDGGSGNITVYSKNFYRFTFNRSTMVLTNELSFDQLGVIGDFNSWGGDVVMNFDTETQMFWADIEFPAEGGFKVRKDGAWDTSWGTATSGAAATSGVFDGGDNITAPAGNYRLYVNFNNPEEMTWELNAADYGTGGGEEPEPEPEPGSTWVVHGQTVATPDWGDIKMVSAGSNISVFKAEGIEVAASSQFGFKDPDGQWYAVDTEFAGGQDPYAVTIGASFNVSTSSVNAVINDAGTYDYWILPDAGRAYVTQTGVKPEYVAGTYGICGTVNGWGDIGDLSMTEDGGYLVRKGVVLTTTDQFKIRYNNEWNDAANFGTESGGAVDVNAAVAVVSSGGSQNMSVSLDGTYDIYFDLDNLTVYVMSEGRTPADVQ